MPVAAHKMQWRICVRIFQSGKAKIHAAMMSPPWYLHFDVLATQAAPFELMQRKLVCN
jgi:hypothetical protein